MPDLYPLPYNAGGPDHDNLDPDAGYLPARAERAALDPPDIREATAREFEHAPIPAADVEAGDEEAAELVARGVTRSRTARHWIGLSPRGYRLTAVIAAEQWGPAPMAPLPMAKLTAMFWTGDPDANPLDNLLLVSRHLDGPEGPEMEMWPVAPEIAHAWQSDDDGITLTGDEAAWLLVALDSAEILYQDRSPIPRRVAESYLGYRGRCICDPPREDLEPADGCPVHAPRCRACGCGDTSPCLTGGVPCSWTRPNLCSRCADLEAALTYAADAAARP